MVQQQLSPRPERAPKSPKDEKSPRIVRHLVVQTNMWSPVRVTELRCNEVRWFYRRKEVDTKWIAFKGHDSLLLEIRWRRDHGYVLDSATEEKANEWGVEEVVVLDGLYQMTEDHSKITAVYWKDDEAELRRGSWFLPDGQPIQAAMAEEIEKHHLQYFRDQTIPDGHSMFSDKEASRKPQLTELQLPENIEVKWSSVIDVFLYSTTKASRFLRYVAWGKDTKLRRGFEKEAEWEDGSPPVSHLVLVVHGIGQKGYENLIAKNTEQIRDTVNHMMEKHYPEEKTRPMFLPVEWRSSLVLDNGLTDVITLPKMGNMRAMLNSTAMDILYYQSPLYRKEIVGGVVRSLNQVYSLFKRHNPSFNGPISIFAHSLGSVISYDILTHWSPLFLYDDYVANVIKEGVLANNDENMASSMRSLQETRELLQQKVRGGIKSVILVKEEQLSFPVTNLFCVGSPLGVFLVMRGAEPQSIMPSTSLIGRVYNIFHPYDPVAYRLEPLFSPQYKDIRPVKVFSFNDNRAKGNYDLVPPDVHKNYLKKKKQQANKEKKQMLKNGAQGDEKKRSGDEEIVDEEDDCDSDDSATNNARSACSSPRSLTPPPAEEKKKGGGWWFNKSNASKKDAIEQAKEVEVPVAEPTKMSEAELILDTIPDELKAPKRVDYNLQPALTDKSYWSVMRSHFSYWVNCDLAMFLVNVIYSPPSAIGTASTTTSSMDSDPMMQTKRAGLADV